MTIIIFYILGFIFFPLILLQLSPKIENFLSSFNSSSNPYLVKDINDIAFRVLQLASSLRKIGFWIPIRNIPLAILITYALWIVAPSLFYKAFIVGEDGVYLISKRIIKIPWNKIKGIGKHRLWMLIYLENERKIPLGIVFVVKALPGFKDFEKIVKTYAIGKQSVSMPLCPGIYKYSTYHWYLRFIAIFLILLFFVNSPFILYPFFLEEPNRAYLPSFHLLLSVIFYNLSFLYLYCNDISPMLFPREVRIENKGVIVQSLFKKTFIPRENIQTVQSGVVLFQFGSVLSLKASLLLFTTTEVNIFKMIVLPPELPPTAKSKNEQGGEGENGNILPDVNV
ncbi:hypothetical protein H5T88_05195 [bacterium]|nr:hypothetical protein [bacterium]